MHDPLEPFIAEAEAGIARCLTGMGYSGEWALEVPPWGMGLRALPCFPLAKAMKRNPADIASEIAAAYRGDATSASAAGPYVNVSAAGDGLARATLASLAAMGERYGTLPATGKKVLLEHTSANPNGPLHVGRTRNPIIGDALGRILRAAGDDVTVEYLVNDIGKQIAILVWGAEHIGGGELASEDAEAPRDKQDHVWVRYYQLANARMESDPAVAAEVESLIDSVESGDRRAIDRFKGTIAPVLEGMLESLARLNIRYDAFAYESGFILDDSVTRVIEGLRRSPLAAEEDGAGYLDMEGIVHGRTARFVFARASGTSLYTTRDVAYHLDKFSRAGHVINVLGEDHRLQARQLALALHELGEAREPEVVFYSFVSLPEGKMSTRRGRVVYMDDLLDEAFERAMDEVERRRPELDDERKRAIAEAVGIGAIRYNIVRVQPEKKIVFRWEDALNFDGDSAPFAQYAHARAASILAKVRSRGEVFGFEPDADERRFIEALAQFPSTVRSCAVGRAPHRMTSYVHDVAVAFNQFYRDCQVIGSERERERLALVGAARTVLSNGLDMLGIAHPDEI